MVPFVFNYGLGYNKILSNSRFTGRDSRDKNDKNFTGRR